MPRVEPVRFSILRQFAKSPAHAKYAMEVGIPETAAMRLGRLVHSLALGTAIPVVWPGDRRGKAWLKFRDAHQGEPIVTGDEMAVAEQMAEALRVHPEAPGLLSGRREETIFFDYAGQPCRVTPDAFEPARYMTELKTTADANPVRFPWHALKMGYQAQMAMQKEGAELAGLAPPERLFVVAVESKPPYAVAVFEITARAEDFGRRLWHGWMEQFLVCEASDSWPGYGLGVIDAPEEAAELVGADGEVIEAEVD